MNETKQNTNVNNRSRQETVKLQPGLGTIEKRNDFSTLTESSKPKTSSSVKKGNK